jgi:hypothetical protein
MKRLTLLLTCLWMSGVAQGHVSSTGFLIVNASGQEVEGSLELAVRDVERAVGLDANRDGKITWGELLSGEHNLTQYVGQHLGLSAKGNMCPLTFEALEVNERVDGKYAWLSFTAHCASAPDTLSIRYRMMDGVDPSHRGLLTLTTGNLAQTGVLGGAGDGHEAIFILEQPSRWRTFLEYLRVGIEHIWGGIDHLLFLISLLLPAVLSRRDGRWEPVGSARAALLDILRVVTAFTAAHSITLTLAALNIIHLPSRLTESIIAASIIVAALNNIFPLVTQGRARIAFAFGLLHGFGFASVLADMGLPGGARLLSLFAFNLGIETGQLAVVLAVMPIVYHLRNGPLYRNRLMPLGSAGIAALALVWVVQRAFLPTG